jgi:hypothetical protein
MQNMSQKLNAHFLSDILDCFNAIFKFQNGYISIHICFDLTGTTTIEFVAIFCIQLQWFWFKKPCFEILGF